jgi:hypothetical protein
MGRALEGSHPREGASRALAGSDRRGLLLPQQLGAPSSPASTSIFGLATWHDYHYYFGHVMWDIEAFASRRSACLQPNAAAACWPIAATIWPAPGATPRSWVAAALQFPWESAPGSGEEAAPLPGTAAWHEDHVSLDVARAFASTPTSGDREFLRTRAWPVLAGVSEWITSRVTKTRAGYAIKASMGIAERESPVDNAAFTNMGAVVVLREAVRSPRPGSRGRPGLDGDRRALEIPNADGGHLARRLPDRRGERAPRPTR